MIMAIHIKNLFNENYGINTLTFFLVILSLNLVSF